MMISLNLPTMQVRYTKGGQLCYKEHICNFVQDLSSIANHLPRLPHECEIILIRKDGVDLDRHIDFIVRRQKIHDALRWKIDNDPSYSHIKLDDPETIHRFNQLPENGTVAHEIRTIGAGNTSDGVLDPAGPPDAGNEIREEGEGDTDVEHSGVLNLGSAGNDVSQVAAMRADAQSAARAPIRYQQQQRFIVCIQFYAAMFLLTIDSDPDSRS
jgi:hypothetical protein